MNNEKFLEGKVALITGSGSGFGRKMALSFAEKGADLVLNDVNLEGIKETKNLVLKDNEVEILLAKADVSKLAEVEEMADKVFEVFDNVFLIVNNAGIDGGLSTSLKAKEEMYDKVMGVNVKGPWNITKTFFRKMKRQKQFKPVRGKIINIASTAGTSSGHNPMLGVYSISKAAVIAQTRVWALELGSSDITVNSIAPGVFLTPIYNSDPKLIRQFLDSRNVKIPIDKIGEAQWVADLAVFLASSTADYITGQNIVIDGGMTLSINKL
ncbi:MAG: SDR family oxidoreductase [Candidatus Lokiarchaeota archaeon]|nr:SDR family oxidoreductase [Candidatus Lokiarchaeota archaeon]MBD3198689.1 SDR family oxidoreductase [Candidatus Lokiarchaeota archaeon]